MRKLENPTPVSLRKVVAVAAVSGVAAVVSLALSPLPWLLLVSAILVGAIVGVVGLLSRSMFAAGVTILAVLAFSRYSDRLVTEPFLWWQPMLILVAAWLIVFAIGVSRKREPGSIVP